MVASQNRSRWAYDPNWIRIEHIDSEGASLGYTEFERADVAATSAVNSRTGRGVSGCRFGIATISRLPEFLLWLIGGFFGIASVSFRSLVHNPRFAFSTNRIVKRGS